MKANELRIGNFTEQGQIKNFWERGVHFGFGKCYEFNELKPIPLTEEWLLKFGFEIDKTYVSEQNPYLDHIKNEVRISMPYFSFEYGDGAFNELKYVHQLQNLYFALTGKELEIIS